jgi:hypothetical protein
MHIIDYIEHIIDNIHNIRTEYNYNTYTHIPWTVSSQQTRPVFLRILPRGRTGQSPPL